MSQQIDFYKAACSQRGNRSDFLVLSETLRYQYGQVISDVLCGIVRFIQRVAQFRKPVAMNGFQTL